MEGERLEMKGEGSGGDLDENSKSFIGSILRCFLKIPYFEDVFPFFLYKFVVFYNKCEI
jgi:hypothetical protein